MRLAHGMGRAPAWPPLGLTVLVKRICCAPPPMPRRNHDLFMAPLRCEVESRAAKFSHSGPCQMELSRNPKQAGIPSLYQKIRISRLITGLPTCGGLPA